MSVSNILTTSGELLFGIALVLMFWHQDKLVRFEKKLGILFRYYRRRAARRIRHMIRLIKLRRNAKISGKFIYVPSDVNAIASGRPSAEGYGSTAV